MTPCKIRRVAKGVEGMLVAYLPLDRTYWRRLVARVTRMTRNEAKAEDYLQSAFLRLAERRSAVEIGNPEAFLMRSVRNLAIDDHRQAQTGLNAAGQLSWTVADCSSQPVQDERLIARQRLDRVQEGLEHLTPRTRDIFLMHRLDGMKYREIAAELGITISAVEKHIAKATLFLTGWAEGW